MQLSLSEHQLIAPCCNIQGRDIMGLTSVLACVGASRSAADVGLTEPRNSVTSYRSHEGPRGRSNTIRSLRVSHSLSEHEACCQQANQGRRPTSRRAFQENRCISAVLPHHSPFSSLSFVPLPHICVMALNLLMCEDVSKFSSVPPHSQIFM